MTTKSPAAVDQGTLFDTAADVARRLRAFDEYGTEARATRALRRRCPGFNEADYAKAFEAALELIDAACALATGNATEFQSIGLPAEAHWQPHVRRLARRHPGFTEATYQWVTAWSIYYFALR